MGKDSCSEPVGSIPYHQVGPAWNEKEWYQFCYLLCILPTLCLSLFFLFSPLRLGENRQHFLNPRPRSLCVERGLCCSKVWPCGPHQGNQAVVMMPDGMTWHQTVCHKASRTHTLSSQNLFSVAHYLLTTDVLLHCVCYRRLPWRQQAVE